MSDILDKDTYKLALAAIKRRLDRREPLQESFDDVCTDFRIRDEAAAESLYEEADAYSESLQDQDSDSFACSCDPSMRDTHGNGAF